MMVIMRLFHVDRALKFIQHSRLICVHNSPEGSRGVRSDIQFHPRRTRTICERSYMVAGQVWREVLCLLPSVLPSRC